MPPRKRSKTAPETPPTLAPTLAPSRCPLPSFEAWMSSNGITWDGKLVKFGNGCGWGVWAVSDISEGSLLCSIPKEAIISIRNTSISDILAKEKLGGGLGLTTAVMYEAAMGKESKWYVYICSLPKREYLPVFWTEDELELLEGTELEGQAMEDREAMGEDFETEVQPLAERYGSRIPKDSWTLDNFIVAASWVASRAFYVDKFHGDALVPLADVFNHKASLVSLSDEYAVAENEDQEGSEEEGEMESMDEGEDEEGEDNDDDEDEEEEEEEGKKEGTGSDDVPELVVADKAAQKCTARSVHKHAADVDENRTAGSEQEAAKKQKTDCTKSDCKKTDCTKSDVLKEEKAGCSHHHHHQHDQHDQHDHRHDDQDQHQHHEGCNHEHHAGGVQKEHQQEAAKQLPGVVSSQANFERYGVNLRLEIGICSLMKDGVDVLDIVAASSVVKGAEVNNTYGEHGNAELVKKYGFALRRNPFNEVFLSKEAVMAAGKASEGQRALGRKIHFLEKHSDLLELDAEPFIVLPGAFINRSLHLVLSILFSEEAEFKRWRSMDDVPQSTSSTEAHAGTAPGETFEDAVAIAGDGACAWTTGMKSALKTALLDRLTQYHKGAALKGEAPSDEARMSLYRGLWKKELKQLSDGGDGGSEMSESSVALRAALGLRVTEQEAVFEALDAL